MMSSRLVKGGPLPQPPQHQQQTDQKKIYMDWANHYLRRAHYTETLTDLHESMDGNFLPKIIHAVVQSTVPGITVSPEKEEDRRRNIKNCVQHLENTGVNCSTFTVADLCDGNMKAILSLFYSLSQFKRTTKSMTSDPSPSRIARPVSPGIKSSHGIHPASSAPIVTNGIAGGAGMGGANKSMISPGMNRRTAGSTIQTSTLDKPFGMRRAPYKSIVVAGDKSEDKGHEGRAEEGGGGGGGKREERSSLQGSHMVGGSTSRLDHLSTKSSLPGPKTSQLEHTAAHVSMSQPSLHRPPNRTKSEPGVGMNRLQSPRNRKDSARTGGKEQGEAPGNQIHQGPSGQRRIMKQPSASIIPSPSGRSTPVSTDAHASGRCTPSRLMRPPSRLTKPGGHAGKSGGGGGGKEMSSDESECGRDVEKTKLSRQRSNSEVKRQVGHASLPRLGASRPGDDPRGLTVSGSAVEGAKGYKKSATFGPDSKLISPSSVPTGDGFRQLKQAVEKEGGSVSEMSERRGGGGGAKKLSGLKAPDQRSMRLNSAGSPTDVPAHSKRIDSGLKEGNEGAEREATPIQSGIPGRKEEGRGGGGGEKNVGGSKLPKGSPLQFGHKFGGGASENRKTSLGLPPSGLTRIQSPSSAHGSAHSPTGSKGEFAGKEGGRGGRGRGHSSSSSSSLESSLGTEHEAKMLALQKLDKPVSVTGSPGQLRKEGRDKLVKPVVDMSVDEESPSSSTEVLSPPSGKEGGSSDTTHNRYSRRISPEGMSIEGQPLSDEQVITPPMDAQERNLKNKQQTDNMKGALIENGKGDQDKNEIGPELEVKEASTSLSEEATTAGEEGGVASDGGREVDVQTPNLSQGSEVTTDSTLSSLSLASISSPPHTLNSSPLTSGQQPETGQAPYSETSSPQPKHTFTPHNHGTPKEKSSGHHDNKEIPELSSVPGVPSPSRHRPPPSDHSLRLPVAKEKAKRAHSLSPKMSRRVFPPPQNPQINVHHHDDSSAVITSPPAILSDRLPHLDLVRMDSPDSVKSDTGVVTSSRKPLRSSLRGSKEKDGSSSSLDSGKLLTSKVTISPRSSQVVFLPDEAGLHPVEAFSQPTILSPVKRMMRDRPSSVGDSYHVDLDDPTKRVSMHSTVSEKLDYSNEESFLAQKLTRDDAQRYNSTPELLETFENQLSTMKMDLANKDRMLSMYESSMADLSSKVHLLKKTLEEKDQEIKHLTEVKQSWYDLEGRSLASRLGSEEGVLSDGCLSDSAMEPSRRSHKAEGKKKKKWKRWSFRKKSKEQYDPTLSLDTESVISGKTSRSGTTIRRHPSKSKTDLMSISEYSIDPRQRDPDTKSFSSDYNTSIPLTYSMEDVVTIFEDPNPGAKAPVSLLAGYSSYSSYYSGGEGEGGDVDGEGMTVLGTLSIAPEISWITMDTKICDIFMHHIDCVDPEGNLGLTEDSILHYFIAEQRREIGNALLPPLTPYQSLATGTTIRIVLKGALQGSCDALAYKVLINSDTLHSYVSLLNETQWLVVMGTKGTCKTSLANGLSRHLMQCSSEEEEEDGEPAVVIKYNVEKEGLERIVLTIKDDLSKKIRMWPRPPILVVDNVYECSDLEQILSAASNLPRRPFIIATLCTATMQGVPLHQLLFHHQIRVATCNPQTEPIFGILSRSLRKQVYKLKAARIPVDPVAERMLQWLPHLLEYLDSFINQFHIQSVTLGPRVFMDCPVDQNGSELETWFINLWNHFVIPYLMGAIMAGIETYTADPQLEWIDVREWVTETYPWQPSANVMKLRTLNPEDVGWNHAVRSRPQQNRFLLFKDDMKLPDDTRSIISRVKPVD